MIDKGKTIENEANKSRTNQKGNEEQKTKATERKSLGILKDQGTERTLGQSDKEMEGEDMQVSRWKRVTKKPQGPKSN